MNIFTIYRTLFLSVTKLKCFEKMWGSGKTRRCLVQLSQELCYINWAQAIV